MHIRKTRFSTISKELHGLLRRHGPVNHPYSVKSVPPALHSPSYRFLLPFSNIVVHPPEFPTACMFFKSIKKNIERKKNQTNSQNTTLKLLVLKLLAILTISGLWKITEPYDPTIPLLHICPKEPKSVSWRDFCTPVFIVTLVPIAKRWEQPCLSTDRWVKKTWYIHKIEYYSAVELKEILPFEMESHYAEKDQMEKDKHCMMSFICGI